jgi:hypothetical protein
MRAIIPLILLYFHMISAIDVWYFDPTDEHEHILYSDSYYQAKQDLVYLHRNHYKILYIHKFSKIS